MSNVINFADRPPTNTETEKRARRAETVRARADEGYEIRKTADREQIAENLYRLLDRLEKDGRIRRVDLCRDMLNSKTEDSTKRLDMYALNPEKEGSKRNSQIARLAKKLTKYVRLAEEAACRAGEDVESVLLDLVHGTDIASSGPQLPEDPMAKDLKAPLIRNLDRAARRVASETGLQRAFQMIARYSLRASDPRLGEDSNQDTFKAAGPISQTLTCLEDGRTNPSPENGGQDWWRLVRTAPQVLLGESVLDCVEEEPQIENNSVNFQVLKDPSNCFGRVELFQEKIERPEGEYWSAVTDYLVQVWLTILPFGSSYEPRLGLRLELLRHVRIKKTQLPFASKPVEVFSKRMPHFCREARWDSREENLRVTVPVNLAPLKSWLDLLMGRELYRDESSPARVLAFSSEEAQLLLDLPDSQPIADWVGPLPDDNSGIQLRPEPPRDMDNLQRWDDWNNERQHAKDRDRRYRFRFAVDQEPDLPELYPMSWKEGTLGYKLERSLLEVEGEDAVIQQLRAQAEYLVAEVQNKIEEALRAREERLAKLLSS